MYLRYLVVTVFCICLVSCYEVNEEIVINDNGTGTYVSNMDLGQLIDMMQTFAGEEEMAKEGMDKVIDTTILMKDIADSAQRATPEQKELVKDGKMSLQMNMKEKIFKIGINIPYKNHDNLQKLMAGDGSGMGMASVFKNLFGKGNAGSQDSAAQGPDMGEFSSIYDVSIKNGVISRTLNNEKFKALTEKPEMAQMKEVTNSGFEVLYTTVFKLPRPVKKSDNPLLKLSDDKKTVTFKYNMLEILEHPDKFAYTIEY